MQPRFSYEEKEETLQEINSKNIQNMVKMVLKYPKESLKESSISESIIPSQNQLIDEHEDTPSTADPSFMRLENLKRLSRKFERKKNGSERLSFNPDFLKKKMSFEALGTGKIHDEYKIKTFKDLRQKKKCYGSYLRKKFESKVMALENLKEISLDIKPNFFLKNPGKSISPKNKSRKVNSSRIKLENHLNCLRSYFSNRENHARNSERVQRRTTLENKVENIKKKRRISINQAIRQRILNSKKQAKIEKKNFEKKNEVLDQHPNSKNKTSFVVFSARRNIKKRINNRSDFSLSLKEIKNEITIGSKLKNVNFAQTQKTLSKGNVVTIEIKKKVGKNFKK